MIQFFRKIRQTLLTQNKLNTYLVYATGEIVLVVIGILIALQINNWNEGKKQFTYESKILKEIYRALQTDSARIKVWIKPRIQRTFEASNLLTKHIHEKRYPGDSLFRVYFRNMRASGYVTINFGPYKTLQSNGLDKIKNEGLRFKLVDLFESVFPRQLSFIERGEAYEEDFRQQTTRALQTYYTTDISEKKIRIRTRVNRDVFLDPRLIQLIASERGVASTRDYRSDIILESISLALGELRDYFDRHQIDYEKKFNVSAVGIRSQLSDSTYVKSLQKNGQ